MRKFIVFIMLAGLAAAPAMGTEPAVSHDSRNPGASGRSATNTEFQAGLATRRAIRRTASTISVREP